MPEVNFESLFDEIMHEQATAQPLVFDVDVGDIYGFTPEDRSLSAELSNVPLIEPTAGTGACAIDTDVNVSSAHNAWKRKLYKAKFDTKSHKKLCQSSDELNNVNLTVSVFRQLFELI